jgi:hypothetical protein
MRLHYDCNIGDLKGITSKSGSFSGIETIYCSMLSYSLFVVLQIATPLIFRRFHAQLKLQVHLRVCKRCNIAIHT